MLYSQAKRCLKETDKETLLDLIDEFGEETVLEYLDSGYSLNDMKESYHGKADSDEEFTQELLESCGEIPKDFPPYIHIDWEATARDIMLDYVEINGYYFRQ